ncbi:MAG: hypothetical protein RJB11_2043 [Planctomycetota bacterium]|jgi:hypothetical protein
MLEAPCKQLLNFPSRLGFQVPQVLQPVNAKASAATANVVRFMIFLLEEIAKFAVERFFDVQLYANIPCVQIDMEKFPTISKVFLTLLKQTSVRVSQHRIFSTIRTRATRRLAS